MSLAYAESFRTSSESPFIDGENLRYFDRETGWKISAEQDGFTFTCTDPADYEYFSTRRAEIAGMLRMCPAAGEIFAYGKTQEGYQTFSVPTLERANVFTAEKLAGLPVAGIQAFQEKDLGNTPVSRYLHDLTDGPVPHLPVSLGHERHFHDLVGHFLGAAIVDTQSLAVFSALSKDAISLWAKGPQWPPKLYVEAIGKGFDTFSDNQLRRTMTSYIGNEGFLLSQTLQRIHVSRREYFPRAVEIVRSFGMDVQSGPGVYPIVVPWEMQVLPRYYEQVAERLR